MATLVHEKADGEKQRVLVSTARPTVLGRDLECDVVLAHPSISRRHAVIRHVDGGFVVEDQSTNGLSVNGERVDSRRLADGDELVLGAATGTPLRFAAGESRLDMTLHAMRDEFAPEGVADLANLRRLMEINKAITTSLELEEVIELLLEGILEISSGMRAKVLLRHDGGEMEIAYERNLEDAGEPVGPEISSTVVDRVVELGQPVLINNVADAPDLRSQASIRALDLRSIAAIPMHYSRGYLSGARRKDSLMGVIYVDNRSARRRFTEEDVDMLQTFAYQGAISLENARLHRDLQENYLALVVSLVEAVEIKDRYTRGHSELVARFAVAIARHLGVQGGELEEIERGALLHDVGKIGIDEAILNKPDRLTDEEYEIIKQHPVYGAQILEPIPYLAAARDIVLQHHERMDGSGYPEGLEGEEISLGARIVAVCDVFEGVTSNRPYREPMKPEEVMALLREDAGSKLDPDCVEAFIAVYEETGLRKGFIGRPERDRDRDVASGDGSA